MTRKSENELAKIVTAWLVTDGWTVYEEVSPWGNNGRRGDLVAKKNSIIWVIETKKHFNLEVLEQAAGWLAYAHFASIAVWQGKRLTAISQEVCRRFNLGFVTVRNSGSDDEPRYSVYEHAEGFFNRRADTSAIRRMLCDETLAVGNAGKPAREFDTPFKQTCRKLLRVVQDNPGIEFEEAVRRSGHHYKSASKAKINLFGIVRAGKIPELILLEDGKRFVLFAAGDEPGKAIASPARIIGAIPDQPSQRELFG